MRLATVVLDIPTRSLDRGFTYSVPKGFPPDLVGRAVLVAFGNRQAVGFVVQDFEGEPSVAVKPLLQALTEPFFTPLGARCALFLSQRYLAPLSSCVRLFIPPGAAPKMVRTGSGQGLGAGSGSAGGNGWEVAMPKVRPVDDRWVVRLPAADSFTPRKGAVKQIAVLKALEHGDLRVADLRAEYGSVDAVLKSLAEKGVVEVQTRRRIRGQEQVSPAFAARVRPVPKLTGEQDVALREIERAACACNGQAVVLDGVTGSGKTEVYLRAIARQLEQGRGAIVLVPEISLTPQTVARFRGRFGQVVAVLHSRMSAGERFDQWEMVRTGAAKVVVGARSALFAPLASIGIIIVDEEHEGSYKQDQAPRYVTRDVAAWMARQAGATLVLGSATPSLEALHKAQACDDWRLVGMPTRANGKPLPQVQVVDMGREFGSGNRRMFSRALSSALFTELDAGRKAVLLLNQRGFAQFVLCRDCGFVPECPSCSTSLTYHERGNRLVCHHCGHERPCPPRCPECGSPYLRRFGAGTQRVEDELLGLLAGREVRVIRMDADTTSRKGSHQRLLEQFAAPGAAVLLGTQMIAKGLDFDEVTLVGVINADTQLHLPDFRASERTYALIEQVSGRCGRGKLPGHVVVQTYQPTDAAIRAAAHHDRSLFLKPELELRRNLGYPPFVSMANVLVWGENERAVQAEGHVLFAELSAAIAAQGSAWTLYPPTPCVLSRLKRVHRYHLLLKAPAGADIAAVVGDAFRSHKHAPGVNASIDIDPQSLL